MSSTRGSLLNTTTGLLLMVKPRDPDRKTEGRSNVLPPGKQADTIKTMDLVGLMVCKHGTAEIAVLSNGLTRGIAHSQRQPKKRFSRNTIDSQQMGEQLEKEDRW